MGHGTPNITFGTYSKWIPEERHADIDELDQAGIDLHPNASYMHPDKNKGVDASSQPL